MAKEYLKWRIFAGQNFELWMRNIDHGPENMYKKFQLKKTEKNEIFEKQDGRHLRHFESDFNESHSAS